MNDQTRPNTGTAVALPSDPMQLMALARDLALARLIPPHFQKSPADCWLVMSFCRSRNLDFMMVVGECSVVQGRLFFSGKLTAALLNTSGYLAERLNYEYAYDDKGNPLAVVVSGRINDETVKRAVTVHIEQVKTKNTVWTTQPEQQLAYAGARIWGRRHMPEVLMGLLFEGEQPMIDVTPTAVSNPQTFEPPGTGYVLNPSAHSDATAHTGPIVRIHDKELAERVLKQVEEHAAAGPAGPAETSGDAYALLWQEIMRDATSADALTIRWNSERAMRGSIVWHDREQPARIKEMVTRRIEELKKAAPDDTR